MKLDFEASAAPFAQRVAALEAQLTGEMTSLMNELGELAYNYALVKIDEMIYETPERDYERTGLLRASIRWFVRQEEQRATITLTTGEGADGIHYGLENEIGRGVSGTTIEEVLERALDMAEPIELEPFERKRGGWPNLEPRPFIIPALAQVYADLEIELRQRLKTLKL